MNERQIELFCAPLSAEQRVDWVLSCGSPRAAFQFAAARVFARQLGKPVPAWEELIPETDFKTVRALLRVVQDFTEVLGRHAEVITGPSFRKVEREALAAEFGEVFARGRELVTAKEKAAAKEVAAARKAVRAGKRKPAADGLPSGVGELPAFDEPALRLVVGRSMYQWLKADALAATLALVAERRRAQNVPLVCALGGAPLPPEGAKQTPGYVIDSSVTLVVGLEVARAAPGGEPVGPIEPEELERVKKLAKKALDADFWAQLSQTAGMPFEHKTPMVMLVATGATTEGKLLLGRSVAEGTEVLVADPHGRKRAPLFKPLEAPPDAELFVVPG